jgi:hypothetical protein
VDCYINCLQAIADGSLVTLVQRLRSQPQIITAYARDALIRDAKAAERLVAQLQQLQVIFCVFEGGCLGDDFDTAQQQLQCAPCMMFWIQQRC